MLDVKYDDKRPGHGLDLQSELSHPTVKRGERNSELPLLGAQTKAVHVRMEKELELHQVDTISQGILPGGCT